MQVAEDLQTILSTSAQSSIPHYFAAIADGKLKQPLCGNPEGWGPLSPYRYDFTPCFLDVWIASVSTFGTFLGLWAIWYLSRKTPSQVSKNWHFYTKLSIIGALVAATILQAGIQTERLPGIWFGDFRFWTSIFTLVSVAVIGYVQYIEHWRSRQPNGVVLFYWLLFVIAYGVKLRSLIAQQVFKSSIAYFVTFCVTLALAIAEFALEYLVPKKQSAYDALIDGDECPIEYADIFSVLTFSWMTPMMKYGYKQFLTQDDLWNLRQRDTTRVTGKEMERSWAIETEKKHPSLWIAIARSFGGPYLRGAIIKTFSDALNFTQPQLLRLLIKFVDSYRTDNPDPAIKGAAIALAMFAVSVSQTVLLHQYFQRAFETGLRIRASLTAMIFSKAMRLSNEGRSSKSTGDIVNYMSVDTQRLQDLTQYGQMLWSAPFQIILCMISLYELIGLSMLAGVGIMVLSIPLNGRLKIPPILSFSFFADYYLALIAKFNKDFQKRQMKNKDSRTRLMTEILNKMNSIKLYAWSQAFMKKLNYVRNEQELKTLRKIGALSAAAQFTFTTTPFLVSCSTFTVFVLTQNKPLSTDLVFPCLTLFNLLGFPLAVLPMVISSIIEATVAVGRLQDFFAAEELQPDAVQLEKSVSHIGDESVRVQNATFTWDRTSDRRCLENISLTAHKGELTCVVGRVGTGKSSLLQAILGDVWKIHGEVTVRGTTAYVAQQAWVMNASVKDNIVFGHRWDPHFYERTIKACALTEDFKTLPGGDQTEVGERGISLSGGQKARLTLARAVYARADIYLLDDCLSAVDQHVGRHLIDNVFGPNGLLNTKTRILATNSIPVLEEANFIVLLRDGHVLEKGTYDQLIAMRGEVANLVKTSNNEEGSEPSSIEESKDSNESESDESKTVYGTGTGSEEEEVLEAQEGFGQLVPIRPSAASGRKDSVMTLRRASMSSFGHGRGKVLDEEAEVRAKKNEEFSEKGKVKWSVYQEYAKACNLIAVGFFLLALVGAQTAQVGGSIWLKHWSEVNERSGVNPDVAKYIGIYFALSVGGSLLMALQALIQWIFCSIEVRCS